MNDPPPEVSDGHILAAVRDGWRLAVSLAEYAPVGFGSLEFRISPLGSDAAQARLTTLAGTHLSDLTTLSYSTNVDQNNGGLPGNGGQAPYLILNVDYGDAAPSRRHATH